MADDENVESMFSRFSKFVCELKSVGMVYSNLYKIANLLEVFLRLGKQNLLFLKMETCKI